MPLTRRIEALEQTARPVGELGVAIVPLGASVTEQDRLIQAAIERPGWELVPEKRDP